LEPCIEPFFDPATFTYSYVLADLNAGKAAVIDPVLDYNPVSGRTSTESADAIIDYVRRCGLELEWILETHIHADHLTGAAYLKSQLGGQMGIGAGVVEVQKIFSGVFNAGIEFAVDGQQFDVLFEDKKTFQVGGLEVQAMSTPGHTPACLTYIVEGTAFVGDTLFMPDYGTARADFPGGDARTLYQSIQKILDLPLDTKLFMCHDYGTEERTEFRFETTVTEERENNILVHGGVDEASFVESRESRDAGLATPRLLYPAVQFNMRAGSLPPAESNGGHYFKIPIRALEARLTSQ